MASTETLLVLTAASGMGNLICATSVLEKLPASKIYQTKLRLIFFEKPFIQKFLRATRINHHLKVPTLLLLDSDRVRKISDTFSNIKNLFAIFISKMNIIFCFNVTDFIKDFKRSATFSLPSRLRSSS